MMSKIAENVDISDNFKAGEIEFDIMHDFNESCIQSLIDCVLRVGKLDIDESDKAGLILNLVTNACGSIISTACANIAKESHSLELATGLIDILKKTVEKQLKSENSIFVKVASSSVH